MYKNYCRNQIQWSQKPINRIQSKKTTVSIPQLPLATPIGSNRKNSQNRIHRPEKFMNQLLSWIFFFCPPTSYFGTSPGTNGPPVNSKNFTIIVHIRIQATIQNLCAIMFNIITGWTKKKLLGFNVTCVSFRTKGRELVVQVLLIWSIWNSNDGLLSCGNQGSVGS